MDIRRCQKLRDYFNEQSGKCAYCHTDMTLELNRPNTATIDHVVPRSKGGKDGRHNELCVCARCNFDKGNLDLLKWLRLKAKQAAGYQETEVILKFPSALKMKDLHTGETYEFKRP